MCCEMYGVVLQPIVPVTPHQFHVASLMVANACTGLCEKKVYNNVLVISQALVCVLYWRLWLNLCFVVQLCFTGVVPPQPQ